MRHLLHKVEFCVIGGGLSGICAAVSAARRGVKVALIHDRPVLGGNASSEIRMWVCGAVGLNNRETGIVEEILLENRYRNPEYNYSIWDSILYEKVRFEPNIELLLNCTCNDAEMAGDKIKSVKGWQLTTQTWHTVEADLFADCSGDSILAELTGADFSIGRESSDEYGEGFAPDKADEKMMGMSCLLQVRQTDRYQKFVPPSWAYKYGKGDLDHRDHSLHEAQNFWWIEVGGEGYEAIYDTEKVRDELLKIVFGVWDHIKNCGDHGAENWALEWVGFLPGKRESRRYLGDYILTQSDINIGVEFDDSVAYGGWPIDDHHPGGFYFKGDPTEFHGVYAPFNIPYRCLYSRNVDNLLFAGRNISVSHVALASTRVMATCATLGQAVGNAAAVAVAEKTSPRGVYENYMSKLQQQLMDDDCFLPAMVRDISQITDSAAISASQGNPEVLRNGLERTLHGSENLWVGDIGGYVQYDFDKPSYIENVRLVFDSDLNRSIIEDTDSSKLEQQGNIFDDYEGLQDSKPQAQTKVAMAENDPARKAVREMRSCYPLGLKEQDVPTVMIKAFKVEILDKEGRWHTVLEELNNYQRLYKKKIGQYASAVRFVPLSTWGDKQARLYAFDVE
ncbi:MAG: FAD-dependent oxidoreductase [Sedimentisphaeraceae bacterium JB056]